MSKGLLACVLVMAGATPAFPQSNWDDFNRQQQLNRMEHQLSDMEQRQRMEEMQRKPSNTGFRGFRGFGQRGENTAPPQSQHASTPTFQEKGSSGVIAVAIIVAAVIIAGAILFVKKPANSTPEVN